MVFNTFIKCQVCGCITNMHKNDSDSELLEDSVIRKFWVTTANEYLI
jgi:hypothetical protein